MTYVKGRECLIPWQSARETELFPVHLNIKVGRKNSSEMCMGVARGRGGAWGARDPPFVSLF